MLVGVCGRLHRKIADKPPVSHFLECGAVQGRLTGLNNFLSLFTFCWSSSLLCTIGRAWGKQACTFLPLPPTLPVYFLYISAFERDVCCFSTHKTETTKKETILILQGSWQSLGGEIMLRRDCQLIPLRSVQIWDEEKMRTSLVSLRNLARHIMLVNLSQWGRPKSETKKKCKQHW